ncbi:MAG: LysR family transcriptional regulator [Archangium sp.]|nr:LysR family transcriptional regulator [Archangium sp.]
MDLDELKSFVAVVETGSLLAASRSLRFARATLRRRIDELEARMGVPLLTRTESGLVPTTAGLVLAKKAKGILRDVGALVGAVREAPREDTEPTGMLRLVAQVGLPPETFAFSLSGLSQRFPRLSLTIRFAEDPLSQLADMDGAVYFGDPPEGAWQSLELFSARVGLFATPEYLARHGTPQSLDDLAKHRVGLWQQQSTEPGLPLKNGDVEPFEPFFVSTDSRLLHEVARRHEAIALVPFSDLIEDLLGLTPLVPVLETQVGAPLTLRLAVPSALSEVPRIRTVFDEVKRVLESGGVLSGG